MEHKHIEIWADSFHEGEWCCNNIVQRFISMGFYCHKAYKNGYLPSYTIKKENIRLTINVYGSYKSWTNIPKKVVEVIEWGKPDFIAYSPELNQILFAVEETAAIPTGNQATQRCERQFGSAHLRIPYWYFISEFGQHSDGGIRRDSPWPTIAALKLTKIYRTPCIVVHYSDATNIEDYNSGKGLRFLFNSLTQIMENFITNKANLFNMNGNLLEQYQDMLDFVKSQWRKVVDFIPSENLLTAPSTAQALCDYALDSVSATTPSIDNLLLWPKIPQLPLEIQQKQKGKALLKYDHLASLLENDIECKKAYALSDNAGSGRPPERDDLKKWIAEQEKLFNKGKKLTPPAMFTMKDSDFPSTQNGNCHITTAKNIVYLYDRWADLKTSIIHAFPRLKDKLNRYDDNTPVFLYLSNSVKPGRIFGDPFTGQLSAFSTAFGKFDKVNRLVVAYFPHQSYTQAINAKKNKGLTLMTRLTNLLLFNAGVAVDLSKNEVL